jgi:hypothetical protein
VENHRCKHEWRRRFPQGFSQECAAPAAGIK